MHIEIYNQICSRLDELMRESSQLESERTVLSGDDLLLKFEKLQQLSLFVGTWLESMGSRYKKEIGMLEKYCDLAYLAGTAAEDEAKFCENVSEMKELLQNGIMPVKDKIKPTEEKYNVEILGSCVSRVIMLNGKQTEHGMDNRYIKMNHFFDKNNIVFCMMPAPFPKEEVESVKASELWESSRIHSLKQCLDKSTVSLILNGKSDYLILDFYDFEVTHAIFRNTAFSTCANEFFTTELFKKHKSEITTFNWKDVPKFLYYPYIDLFFEKISEKYDNNHIILNRFRATSHYIDKQNKVQPIPEKFLQPFHANYHYNETVRNLENYIIDKYHPYVIDLSKYFVGDEHLWDNLNGAHFQKIFYEESFQIIKDIIFGQPKQKVFDGLTPKAVTEILETALCADEFEKYLQNVSNPFCTGLSVDEFVSQLSMEKIA